MPSWRTAYDTAAFIRQRHPAMIHGIGGNAPDTPRMMLVHRINCSG